MIFAVTQLAFSDRVHGLDAGDQDPGTAKAFESEHRASDSFDGLMDWLDDAVHVLRLVHLDGQAFVSRHVDESGRVGAALVDGDLLRHGVQADGALEEYAGRNVISLSTQKEANRLAVMIDRPVGVRNTGHRKIRCNQYRRLP